ncbi:MAG: AAA family ATPase [Desulfovibrionaceae bacterium]|nr:AAA family ATPase [Desulfovibrionaceae bacterium]
MIKDCYRNLIPSTADALHLLEAMVEIEARQGPPFSLPPVGYWPDIRQLKANAVILALKVWPDGSVNWVANCFGWQGTVENSNSGWLSLFAAYENISTQEALHRLATKYNINPQAPLEVDAERRVPFGPNDKFPPDGNVKIDGEPAELKAALSVAYPHYGTQYELGCFSTSTGKTIHIPWHKRPARYMGQNEYLQWGFDPKAIPLFGLDLLDKFPAATVLLVDDAWVAHEINNALSGLADRDPIVAMAFWAGCNRLNQYNWLPLCGRRVFYSPTLHPDALVAGLELRERLMTIGVADFTVLMRPWIDSADVPDDTPVKCGEYACSHLSAVTRRNIYYLKDDINGAWDFARYKRFCQQEGWTEVDDDMASESTGGLFRSTAEICSKNSGKATLAEPMLARLLDPSNITMVVGASDAGKSLIARTLAVAVAAGVAAFGFAAGPRRDVYIVSAEQDAGKVEAYTRRVMTALGVASVPENLYDLPLVGSTLPEAVPSYDLQDAQWQECLLKEVGAGAVLIVDNLLATSAKSPLHVKMAQDIRAFAGRLAQKGCALVVVHHMGKDGKTLGSSSFESLAQNVIMVHRAAVREGYEGGVNALVTFTKCKDYPQLSGKSFSAHLALDFAPGNASWVLEEVESRRGPRGSVTTNGPEQEEAVSAPDVAGLPEIHRVILNYAHKHDSVARKDIVAMGYKGGTVKNNLNALVTQGKLQKHGDGKGTNYTLACTASARMSASAEPKNPSMP